MIRLAVCAFALVLATAAQGEPLPLPQVDYEGDWRMEPANGISAARIHYSAAKNAFRIDMTTADGVASVVRDMTSGEMFVWGAASQGVAMRLNAPAATPQGEPSGAVELVAGLSCDVWQGPELRVCLNEDNIPLTATSRGTSVMLVNLERKEQPTALFALPPGVQIMELPPAMMKQMEKMQGGMPGRNALPF